MVNVRIITSMKIVPSYGPKRTRRTQVIALIVAVLLATILVTQLFGYEDFATTLAALIPFNDKSLLSLSAGVIVIAELLALPYLLRMYLSPLMRAVSGCLAAGVSIFWMFTAFTNSHASNCGLFSTTLELPGGILATAWSLLLFAGIVLVIRADIQTTSAPLRKSTN